MCCNCFFQKNYYYYYYLLPLHNLLSEFEIISIISLTDAKRFLINANFPKVWEIFGREFRALINEILQKVY